MPIIRPDNIEQMPLHDGAMYQTFVGDDAGSTPVRLGVQESPPGFTTGDHHHPYWEYVTVLDGQGTAWIDGENDGEEVAIGPGDMMAFPPGVLHRFSVAGDEPLRTFGIHVSPDRIVLRD